VLAYAPEADRRFAAVDRPNVRDVDVDAAGDRRLLGWGVRGGVYGLAAVAGGLALDAVALGSTLSVDAPAGRAPVSGVLAVTDALADAFALLTTLLLGGGGLVVVAALCVLARYYRTRRPGLVVERFGAESIRLPASRSESERAATALSAALASDRRPGGGADQ
jgi:hypothetical protein